MLKVCLTDIKCEGARERERQREREKEREREREREREKSASLWLSDMFLTGHDG